MDDLTLFIRMQESKMIMTGEFTLKNNSISPVYVNLRPIVSHPDILKKICQRLSIKAIGIGCDRICGIPYAGFPIAFNMIIPTGIPAIYFRKEEKEYGTKQKIEGEYNVGDYVLIIDDVATDAGSKLLTAEVLKNAGLKITDFLILIDRCQGASEILKQNGYKLHSLFKLPDIIETLYQAKKIELPMRDKVLTYLSQNRFDK